jgi:hypothetical protein
MALVNTTASRRTKRAMALALALVLARHLCLRKAIETIIISIEYTNVVSINITSVIVFIWRESYIWNLAVVVVRIAYASMKYAQSVASFISGNLAIFEALIVLCSTNEIISIDWLN